MAHRDEVMKGDRASGGTSHAKNGSPGGGLASTGMRSAGKTKAKYREGKPGTSTYDVGLGKFEDKVPASGMPYDYDNTKS